MVAGEDNRRATTPEDWYEVLDQTGEGFRTWQQTIAKHWLETGSKHPKDLVRLVANDNDMKAMRILKSGGHKAKAMAKLLTRMDDYHPYGDAKAKANWKKMEPIHYKFFPPWRPPRRK